MSSPVDICNLALAKISQDQIISLGDPSVNARWCKSNYEQVRDEVLEGFDWRFAIRVAELVQLPGEAPIEWKNRFQLPQNCLRIISINDCSPQAPVGNFEQQGLEILTDASTVRAKYIMKIEDVTVFPASFRSCLATLLASRIAKPLTGSADLGATLLSAYLKVDIVAARRANAFLKKRPIREQYVNSSLVNSRRAAGRPW